MSKEEEINEIIKKECDANKISDGYHTFSDLYEHRIVLYMALCKQLYWAARRTPNESNPVWKSQVHSDGDKWDGWFLLGIDTERGRQITYHLPMKYWDQITYAEVKLQAPPFDGHGSVDVLDRLQNL